MLFRSVMKVSILMSKNDENQGLEGLDYLGYLDEGQRYKEQEIGRASCRERV